jgi:phage-related protein
MDSNYYQNRLDSYTSTMENLVSSVVPDIPNLEDPLAYKSQFICKICCTTLKESRIHVKNRKFHCKFCREAVCKKCSNLKCYHTVNQATQRICIACFNNAIKNIFKRKIENKVVINHQINKQNKTLNLLDIEYIKEKNENLKEKVKEKQAELNKLKLYIQDLISASAVDSIIIVKETDERTAFENELKEKKQYLSELENKIFEGNRVVSSKSVELDSLRNQLQQLVSILKNQQTRKLETPQILNSKEIQLLKDQVYRLNGIIRATKHDIRKLESKIEKIPNPSACTVQ